MTTTHTPGPWTPLNKDRDDKLLFWDIEAPRNGEYRGPIAMVHSSEHIGGITRDERDANARLIASAPALLEALEKAREQFLFYEQSHLAKYSAEDLEHVRKGIVDVPQGRDAYEKALVNRDMAAMCETAIASARGAA